MTSFEIVISVVGAVSAAVIGSLFTMWLQRSQPWIGLVSVDRDDSHLVPISQELEKLSNESRWIPANFKLVETAPLHKLIEYTDYIEDLIQQARKALDSLNNVDQLLKQRDSKVDEQKQVVENLLSNSLIQYVLHAMISRDELPLPNTLELSSTNLPLLRSSEFVASDSSERGIFIYGTKDRYYISAGKGFVGDETLEKIRLTVKIFQYFVSPKITDIDQALKDEIQREYQRLLEIRERLKDAVRSRKLVIKAQIANMGGSPEHIEPFGILKIKSAGKPINPSVVSVQKF